MVNSDNPSKGDIQSLGSWLETERSQGNQPTAKQIARDFSFTEDQLRGFNFVFGSHLPQATNDPLAAADQAGLV